MSKTLFNYWIHTAMLLLVVLTSQLLVGESTYGQASFQGLGDLPGRNITSFARDVSPDGNTVVGISTSFGTEAFRWQLESGLIGLGDLTGGNFFRSFAAGTSADGSVVVGTGTNYYGNTAIRWEPNVGMTSLGSGTGTGISDDGSMICYHKRINSRYTDSYLWTPNGAIRIPVLPTSSSYRRISAYGISGDGNVVVGHSDSNTGIQAFRWDESNGTQGLGDLRTNNNNTSSVAFGASNDGAVIVGRARNNSNQSEAFRWNSITGMEGLGDLDGPWFYSYAIACSSDGNVVVGQGSTASGTEAFIWDDSNGIRNLKDVLESDHGLDLTGWTLHSAKGVSDDGRVIVGEGRNPQGNWEAWRAELGPDNTGPTVTCPQSQTAECVAGGAEIVVDAEVFDADGDQLDVTWNVTFPDGSTDTITDSVAFSNSPVPTIIQLDNLPFYFPLGTSSVSLSVDDGVSEIEACSPITITVEDTASPVIMTLMEFVEVGNDPGECFATVDLDSAESIYRPVFSDVCSPNVSATHDAPATFEMGATTFTWTVDDGNGNTLTVIQTVIVSDQEAPTATAPANITVGHDAGMCEATFVDLGTPDASDNCEVTSFTNDAMEPFPLGDTEVTWYISDAAGNTMIVNQMVTVTNEDPIAYAGSDQVLECNSNEGYELALDGTASSDADVGDLLVYHWDAVDISFDDPDSATPTATFPHGSTTVQLTVTDQCGGSSTTDLLIIVEDTTSPQIQAALVDQNVLWPPNHDMIPIALDLLVSDLCSAPENLTVICYIDSDESDDGNGDGSFTGDVDGVDGHAQAVEIPLTYNPATERWQGDLELRAERDGGGDGRKYSIRCVAADQSGNATIATVCVTVPKSRGRGNR